jgi:hypothetical protein
MFISCQNAVPKYLVVLSVGLTLGIQDSGPVFCFVVELGVDIDLDLNSILGLANRVGRDTGRGEGSSDKFSDSGWAPLSNDITSLQTELRSQNGVLDGSVSIDLSEGKGLVDRGALVSKGVDGSTRVDGNADSKSTGNTRSGKTRLGEVINRDTWNVLKLGLELSHAQGSARSGRLLGSNREGGGAGEKGGKNGELHLQYYPDL